MSDYLPLEVIGQILERLPIKCVARCMCVCKAWNSIIANHSFIISHHQRLRSNPTRSSLFFHHLSFDPLMEGYFYSLYSHDDATKSNSLSFLKSPPFHPCQPSHSWSVVGICNGLVCFAEDSFSPNPNPTQVVIWNPSILKYLLLPKSSPTFETHGGDYIYYGFGFDSRNHDFKLVRIFDYWFTEIGSRVEIYSLASHSWRSITVSLLRILGIGKFVNGVLHCQAYREINRMAHYFIWTFDFVEEKFGELMLPQCLKGAQKMWEILKGGDFLALKYNSGSLSEHNMFCSIWVMKEYGVVESWTQLFRFDLTSISDLINQPFITRPLLGVLAFKNNEELVIIYSNQHEIAFMDPIKGSMKKIEHGFGNILYMEHHVESLFLINEKNAKAYLSL